MRRRKSSFASPSGGCGRGGCSSRRGSIGGATARGTGEGEEEERGLVLRDARGQKGGLVLRDCETRDRQNSRPKNFFVYVESM